MREYAGIAWDRDPSPAGIVRQLAGIFASGDRTAELAQIDVPTLVIHGDRDRMVHPTGGAATARAIPGARLETIVGLGHDLPAGAWDRIIDLITDHTHICSPDPHRTRGECMSTTQDDQRPHGGHHRRGIGHRPRSGAAAFGTQLPGGDRRRRRDWAEGDGGLVARSGAVAGA